MYLERNSFTADGDHLPREPIDLKDGLLAVLHQLPRSELHHSLQVLPRGEQPRFKLDVEVWLAGEQAVHTGGG